MAVKDYPFTIESEFPNAAVDYGRLTKQIHDSSIETALDHIDGTPTTCTIWFKAELSTADKVTLYGNTSPPADESIVGSHSGLPLVEPQPMNVLNADDSVWHQPLTSQGTPLQNPNILAPGYMFYGTGAFDDITNAKRGEGAQITVVVTEAGDETIEGQFLEHVYILGGDFDAFDTPERGDWCSMHAVAPASAPTSTPGEGNANKVNIAGPYNIIVPAVDGDWTVDGETLLAGEINEDLVPVPNKTGAGYWNWDPTVSPSITPANGDGVYDLYDFPNDLVRQANRIHLRHTGECCPEAIKGKKFLPHWKFVFTAHKAAGGTGAVDVEFILKTSRRTTL